MPRRKRSQWRRRKAVNAWGAWYERDLIQERTRAGLAAAASRGRRGGRKPVITDDKLKRAQAMAGTGLTVREIATRLKVGKTALYQALRPEPT